MMRTDDWSTTVLVGAFLRAGRAVPAAALLVALAALGALVPVGRADAASAATFSMTPSRGPSGTVVHLRSVTPCPPSTTAQGGVAYATTSDAIAVQSFTPTMAPDGSWTATFTADPGASPGASGSRTGPATVSVSCNGGTSLDYESQTFDVTTSGNGYWLLSPADIPEPCGLCGPGSTTNVLGFGEAGFYGPAPAPPVWAAPLVAMAADPVTGTGYWLVGADGGVFGFGDAAYHGSLPGDGLQVRDVVGMAASPDGGGYWLVGADGGVFAFGDAPFTGSMGGQALAAPVVAMASSADGDGYWLAGADGGIFAFGGAPYEGSCSGCTDSSGTPDRFVALAPTPRTSAA